MLNVVLHEPEIPFNTGAIGRTCVATDTALHMIRPFGFVLTDKYVKRAGMDYWPKLNRTEYMDYADFLERHPEIQYGDASLSRNQVREIEKPRLWFLTTKGLNVYSNAPIGPNDYLMFGKESAGIPEEILIGHPESCLRIPMWGDIRSLNLSNSVAIVLYEALRQNDYLSLKLRGSLHHLHWQT